MTIRFSDMAPSGNAEYPFLPGQIITVAEPTPEMLEALRDGRAEVLKTDDVEFATVRAPRQRKAPARSTR